MQTAPGISMPSRTNRLTEPYKPNTADPSRLLSAMPSSTFCPATAACSQGTLRVGLVCAPKLIQHPASATGARSTAAAGGFHIAVHQRNAICQGKRPSPTLNHCTALNLILSEIRFAVCGGQLANDGYLCVITHGSRHGTTAGKQQLIRCYLPWRD